MSFVERILDDIFPYQIISETDCEALRDGIEAYKNPYLKRYFIYGKHHKPRIFLHKIITSDPGRELHSHPWNFLSIILWGGYVEESFAREYRDGAPTKLKKKYPGMILFRPANFAHRLHLTKPAWTLVFTSGKKIEWGFHTIKGWLHWKKYEAYRCDVGG
jgi:hypothetical protein